MIGKLLLNKDEKGYYTNCSTNITKLQYLEISDKGLIFLCSQCASALATGCHWGKEFIINEMSVYYDH